MGWTGTGSAPDRARVAEKGVLCVSDNRVKCHSFMLAPRLSWTCPTNNRIKSDRVSAVTTSPRLQKWVTVRTYSLLRYSNSHCFSLEYPWGTNVQ